mgnify:CR=1 FL=1
MKLQARPVRNLNRKQKALMIDAFLRDTLGQTPQGLRILDVGCGNGEIYAHFSKRNFSVGVDIQDQRRVENKHLPFCLSESEYLPFDSLSFDIVISHHVIEHVNNQNRHLSEIRRILSPDGICYIGTPNKSSPFMRGHLDNPKVLYYNQMRQLFESHGFVVNDCYIKYLHEPFRYHCEVNFGRFIPLFFLRSLQRWFPSQCFILR